MPERLPVDPLLTVSANPNTPMKLKTNKHSWSTLAMKMLDSGDVSDHPYQAQFEEFFKALDKGKDMPLTSFADAARSHEVIFAADKSAATGRSVKLKG